MKYTKLVSQPVPQTEALDARQVQNNAGGFVYQIDDFARLDRFIILGSDSSTYYQFAKALTKENCSCVQRVYDADHTKTIAHIVDISDQGRAAKNNAAIFALAIGVCHTDVKVRQAVLKAMPKVCRTGTHLFQFVGACKVLGRNEGSGRALPRAIADWYDNRSVYSLAVQMIKFRNREGYNHKRLLQISHPKGGNESPYGKHESPNKPKTKRNPETPIKERVIRGVPTEEALKRRALYRWVCGKEYEAADLPDIVKAHLEVMKPETPQSVRIAKTKEFKLPWEALPTDCTKDPNLWKVMLPDMGMTALIRNLGGMTQYGALKPLEPEVRIVIDRLTDENELRKARIHPFNVLMAHAVYKSGKSVLGERTWKPIPQIVGALDDAFYKSFKVIEPSGKRTMICLDVSSSMSSPLVDSYKKERGVNKPVYSPLSVCEGAAAMAMTTMRSESNWHVMGFADRLRDLKFTGKESLDDVLKKTKNVNFGGTDCSLPMVWALEKNLSVDTFIVYTDNETYAGLIHPSQALKNYRRKTGIPAKLIVVGMTSTGFSIADPADGGMMDVCGFDANAPAIMADFAR